MFHLWLSLDLAGISLGVCACYIPAVYYAFYCHAVSTCIPIVIALESYLPVATTSQLTIVELRYNEILNKC